MDLEYLGSLSFNYSAIAFITVFFFAITNSLFLSSLTQGMLSPLSNTLGANIATLILYSILGSIGTVSLFLYRRKFLIQDIENYDTKMEASGVFMPVILTPLLGILLGAVLLLTGKLLG